MELNTATQKYRLLFQPTNEIVAQYYQTPSNYAGDSGFDLYVPEDYVFKPFETKFVNFRILCEMMDEQMINQPYYLYARSSISKTPLILHNGVGIIDAGYRGDIIGALRYIPYDIKDESEYVLKKDTKLLQICSRDLSSFCREQVVVLSSTERGANGFGSTGQ